MIKTQNSILPLLLLLCTALNAEEPVKGILRIGGAPFYPGDSIFLELEIRLPKEANIKFPDQHPPIPSLFALGSPGEQVRYEDGNMALFTKSYAYLALDSLSGAPGSLIDSAGSAISISYSLGEAQHLYTFEPSTLQVIRIPVDTSWTLRMAYGPEPATMTTRFRWWWTALGLFLLLASAGGYWFFKKRRSTALSIPANKDPKEWALEQLDGIQKARPFAGGEQKKYLSLLSEVLRLYFERQTGFPAPYRLSSEWLSYLDTHAELSFLSSDVQRFTQLADAVKFAGYQASQSEEEEFIHLAERLIHAPALMPLNDKGGAVHA
jgi:hypothetical protein